MLALALSLPRTLCTCMRCKAMRLGCKLQVLHAITKQPPRRLQVRQRGRVGKAIQAIQIRIWLAHNGHQGQGARHSTARNLGTCKGSQVLQNLGIDVFASATTKGSQVVLQKSQLLHPEPPRKQPSPC
jgi:hypothetical protein